MDNASIHHDAELVKMIENFGAKVEFLPAYSPDYNPIEEAFSTIKAWLRRNNHEMEAYEDPETPLLMACSQIDNKRAEGYFRHLDYLNYTE
jgi:transposase